MKAQVEILKRGLACIRAKGIIFNETGCEWFICKVKNIPSLRRPYLFLHQSIEPGVIELERFPTLLEAIVTLQEWLLKNGYQNSPAREIRSLEVLFNANWKKILQKVRGSKGDEVFYYPRKPKPQTEEEKAYAHLAGSIREEIDKEIIADLRKIIATKSKRRLLSSNFGANLRGGFVRSTSIKGHDGWYGR